MYHIISLPQYPNLWFKILTQVNWQLALKKLLECAANLDLRKGETALWTLNLAETRWELKDKTYKKSNLKPWPFWSTLMLCTGTNVLWLMDYSCVQNWKTTQIFHCLLFDSGYDKHFASVSLSSNGDNTYLTGVLWGLTIVWWALRSVTGRHWKEDKILDYLAFTTSTNVLQYLGTTRGNWG